jgi:glycosyltransferase involved in cell wall biosynthesis
MTDVRRAPEATIHDLPDDVIAQIERTGPCDIVIGVATYNNAATIAGVADAARAAVDKHFHGVPVALVNADAGSADGTPQALALAGLPAILAHSEAPPRERTEVPFHGVPGRGEALRTILGVTHRLGARVLVLLEADVTTITDEWPERLARPIREEGADWVTATYVRHRYDGTITRLLLSPLVRALYGRRLRQPLGGQQALSARLVEHLLVHPRWNRTGRDVTDVWILGTAIADGFAVWEALLGPYHVQSATRTMDLPTMVAETLGSVFTVMDRHEDLWREVRGSEPVPGAGEVPPASTDPIDVDVDRMIEAFRLGLRDLTTIWEHILAAETLGDVLTLDVPDAARFRFPDDLWARIVYDFALGHHYGVVHRDHLLRSLVPLYLGRTAAFVVATRERSAVATEAHVDAVGAAFERQKPYLVDRWR